MPHISLRNLSVRYRDRVALQDVSVDIPDGQITAIIGPSGCGKTTLLKSLNRLIDLYDEVRVHGRVLIDGDNIYDPGADVLELRKKVGFLSQKPYPLPMSIYDNVAYGPRMQRMNREQILEQVDSLGECREIAKLRRESARQTARTSKNGAMELLVECYLRIAGLWDEVKDRLHDPAVALSVGQQQRLALARALAVEPEVILADEPTSALDPISAQLIEEQFQILKKKYTIVVVTHILRQAQRIGDYVLFLYLGQLVEHGTAQEVFGSPRDDKTRAYVTGDIS
ncbi:MAG: ATP-binding cassette domain-containing protein [Anaerolineae bacterium]|nr:ATP-binding cassette domain-containing protein [Anaerolineae bacterium]NIN99808.1 ATP-binding cassette domain-containing protein [Anaerolineae bacterium]NIQ78685.1 ATP-binding cassette domain-containing protein [Anaerolineae bacterium]